MGVQCASMPGPEELSSQNYGLIEPILRRFVINFDLAQIMTELYFGHLRVWRINYV